MSRDWEEALTSKIDEQLYNIIIGEGDDLNQRPELYIMLLYFAMKNKRSDMEDNSIIDEELQRLSHEMKEFQEVQEIGLKKIP